MFVQRRKLIMTSNDSESISVWIQLPGQREPVLCGKTSRRRSSALSTTGEFVYGKRYLARADAMAIDPVLLPLAQTTFSTSLLGGHFGVILDAGPDGWGKLVIDKTLGSQTNLGYLLQNKGDQVGTLSFSATIEAPPSTPALLSMTSLDALYGASRSIEKNEEISPELAALFRGATSAGGARPKATIVDDGKVWLSKFPSIKDSPQFPSIPQLEAAVLDLADLAGIEVPERRVVHLETCDILLVERFDRKIVQDQEGSWIAKYSFASARSVFFSNPELQKWSFTGTYPRLAKDFSKWSINAQSDRLELFKRLVFNCVVSNTDDHDLNHGLIYVDSGFKLAPAFDMVPQSSGTARRQQALGIGEDGANSTLSNVLSGSAAYGLTKEEAQAIASDVIGAVRQNWEQCIVNRGVSTQHCDHLADYFCPASFFDMAKPKLEAR